MWWNHSCVKAHAGKTPFYQLTVKVNFNLENIFTLFIKPTKSIVLPVFLTIYEICHFCTDESISVSIADVSSSSSSSSSTSLCNVDFPFINHIIWRALQRRQKGGKGRTSNINHKRHLLGSAQSSDSLSVWCAPRLSPAGERAYVKGRA